MAALPSTPFNPDRYVVIHVATTCDEHGVYVTKDSAEVIEIGWILVDAKTLEEVGTPVPIRLTASAPACGPCPIQSCTEADLAPLPDSCTTRASSSSLSTRLSPLYAVSTILLPAASWPPTCRRRLSSSSLPMSFTPLASAYRANGPPPPFAASLTTLTWEHVRNAGNFRDAVNRFDSFASEQLNSQNLDFVFVTLDAWDLRVQLPREARDKAVVLPPYLQHSRTFDLRTEYQRWQQHHPESLPFGPSSLANICAALEVEAVQSSAPIKHNLPFHLQALAPASPRRAMDEAITLARVLRGLIRKSQPQSEHPDVLTRPMDARADVRAFLSERSKVLHMSGLPHDTTQSELESWFTQFGGRPIAFWTLRTPEQHKPTGTGFAVFSSHEEVSGFPRAIGLPFLCCCFWASTGAATFTQQT